MRVFLTGGTGFIGRPLTQALLARGWEVVALARQPNGPLARGLTKLGARCVAGDVTQRETMRAGMTGADIVVHNAGWYEFGLNEAGRKQMHAINVTGTENVLSLAQELMIPRSVHVSSNMYYGETGPEPRDETFQRNTPYRTYYEQTKAEAHEVALRYIQHGLPLSIVCPSVVVGPNDHSIWGYYLRLYLNYVMTPFAWAPETVTSGTYVNDVGEGIALVAEKGRVGETYLLAGDPMRLRDIVGIWNAHPGGFKILFYIPAGLAELLFAPMEPVLRLLGLPAFASRETVKANAHLNNSSLKAQRELGWTHRPAHAMWQSIIADERQLQTKRKWWDMVGKLKPLEIFD